MPGLEDLAKGNVSSLEHFANENLNDVFQAWRIWSLAKRNLFGLEHLANAIFRAWHLARRNFRCKDLAKQNCPGMENFLQAKSSLVRRNLPGVKIELAKITCLSQFSKRNLQSSILFLNCCMI